MTELEITGDRVFKVWWLLTWRVAVAGILFAILKDAADNVIPSAHTYITIIGFIVLLCWNLKVTGMALRKRYEDFRIVLVPVEPTPPA